MLLLLEGTAREQKAEPCERRETLTEIAVPQMTDFQLPELHHVGIVVRDRDATIRHYQEIMGITSFFSFDSSISRALVHGEPTPFDLRVGYAWLGNTMLELLQPLDRVSPHFQFLEEHGEGMHHLQVEISRKPMHYRGYPLIEGLWVGGGKQGSGLLARLVC
jgi:catechol 2,3-dioxygenase-like lactoylglutathione lyase family enzyme